MHPKLRRALTALRGRGLEPDIVADFDALLELERLAQEEQHPGASAAAAWLDRGVPCGGFVFRRMSFAAADWFAFAMQHLPRDGVTELLANAWALVYGRDPAAVAANSDPDKLLPSLRKFAGALQCSPEALAEVVRELAPNPLGGANDAAPKDDRPVAWGETLARLTRTYGGSSEQWLFEKPLDMVGDAIAQVAELEHRRMAEAAALQGKNVGFNASSRQARAHMEFTRTLRTLERTIQTRAEVLA
jgi:hypothetical protein